LGRARRSISKSDIGSKIDAGRYPLLALLLLVAPPAPLVPVLGGHPGAHVDRQRSSAHFLASREISLHPGSGKFVHFLQVSSLQSAISAQHFSWRQMSQGSLPSTSP
jgi:hypothetical protein